MKGQIWENKPLEYWAKAKELRAKWEKSSDRPDKVVDCHTKRGQQCRDFAPVPQWASDYTCYIGPVDGKPRIAKV